MSSQQAQSKGAMPSAEVVRLIDLVNYQEGAVVSRTVVKRTTGTVMRSPAKRLLRVRAVSCSNPVGPATLFEASELQCAGSLSTRIELAL